MASKRRQLDSQYAEALLRVPHTRKGVDSREGESLYQYIARLRAELQLSVTFAEQTLQKNPLTKLVVQELGKGLEQPFLQVGHEGDLWICGESAEDAESEMLSEEIRPVLMSAQGKRSYVSEIPLKDVLDEMGRLLGCDFSTFGRARRPRYDLIQRTLKPLIATGAPIPPIFFQHGLVPAVTASLSEETPVVKKVTRKARISADTTASSVEALPVEAPPVEAPPVEAPPVEAPPVEAPPSVEAPLVEAPSVEVPQVEAPLAEDSPVASSLMEVPPVETPLAEAPPTKVIPVEVSLDLADLINDSVEGEPSLSAEKGADSLVSTIAKRRKKGVPPSIPISGVAQQMLQKAASFDVDAEIAAFKAQNEAPVKAH